MRVSDNPALSEAVNSGAYVIPVFIYDDGFPSLAQPQNSVWKKVQSPGKNNMNNWVRI